MFRNLSRRAYTASARLLAAEQAASSAEGDLVVNFCTPYKAIMTKKVVDMITLPGEGGVYAITKGHAATISQLLPGVVSITTGANAENFFVPGGFALTHANNVTDVSVPEAFPLADLDENKIKESISTAQKVVAGEAEGSEAKQVAQIELDTLYAMGRAIGMSGI